MIKSKFFKRIITLFGVVAVMSPGVDARIPLSALNGLMKNFKVKEYAPCYGQMLLSNGLLHNMRIYGNYSMSQKKMRIKL